MATSAVVGGPYEVYKATSEVQKICDEVKCAAENKAGKKFTVFTAKSYITQVVAGTNYFIKVDVGGNFVHLRVHKSLLHAEEKLELHGIQISKSQKDPIECF